MSQYEVTVTDHLTTRLLYSFDIFVVDSGDTMVVCYWMGSWNKIVLLDSISEDERFFSTLERGIIYQLPTQHSLFILRNNGG